MNHLANLETIKKSLPSQTTLVAVTKNRSAETITALLKAGITVIAENRIQEAKQKFPYLPDQKTIPHERHLIGHLQTNKTKDAVHLFDMIQSVDSLKLAQKIDEECKKVNKKMPILIQVNIAHDPNKHGIDPDQLSALLPELTTLTNLELRGLMTIPPPSKDPESSRPYFRALKALATKHNLPDCSMGMSDDYQIAIGEGATMVRLGNRLFHADELPK